MKSRSHYVERGKGVPKEREMSGIGSERFVRGKGECVCVKL